MIHRICKPPKKHSFFLFGARATGKSTWVNQELLTSNSFAIDLLQADNEERYLLQPDLLINDIQALAKPPDWVFIDEIQKVPKLLDLAHHLIEKKKLKFILTGSSARKLKRGQANLLAGRAFVLHMFPLTALELGSQFKLESALEYGTLPGILDLSETEKARYLRAYTQTYLKEEIQIEQIIRKLKPFREFLEIAAQTCGQCINYSKIAREVGVDTKTVQSYYQILEDTLLGFLLPAYHKSLRKTQSYQPKFYYFDTGVRRALERSLVSKLVSSSYAYGSLFEHFLICEVYRLNSYFETDYRLSYFRTGSSEIDLILSRGRETVCVEIKSNSKVDPVRIKKFAQVASVFKGARKYFVSQQKQRTKIENIDCCHWQDFLQEIFL